MNKFFELLYYEKIFDYLIMGLVSVGAIIFFIVMGIQIKIHNKKVSQKEIKYKYKYKKAIKILHKKAIIKKQDFEEIDKIQKQSNCKDIYLKYMPHEIVLFINDKKFVFWKIGEKR